MSYQGRIQLVKGWDAVFSRLEEHLNGLQSMRASPHFHAVQVPESSDCAVLQVIGASSMNQLALSANVGI